MTSINVTNKNNNIISSSNDDDDDNSDYVPDWLASFVENADNTLLAAQREFDLYAAEGGTKSNDINNIDSNDDTNTVHSDDDDKQQQQQQNIIETDEDDDTIVFDASSSHNNDHRVNILPYQFPSNQSLIENNQNMVETFPNNDYSTTPNKMSSLNFIENDIMVDVQLQQQQSHHDPQIHSFIENPETMEESKINSVPFMTNNCEELKNDCNSTNIITNNNDNIQMDISSNVNNMDIPTEQITSELDSVVVVENMDIEITDEDTNILKQTIGFQNAFEINDPSTSEYDDDIQFGSEPNESTTIDITSNINLNVNTNSTLYESNDNSTTLKESSLLSIDEHTLQTKNEPNLVESTPKGNSVTAKNTATGFMSNVRNLLSINTNVTTNDDKNIKKQIRSPCSTTSSSSSTLSSSNMNNVKSIKSPTVLTTPRTSNVVHVSPSPSNSITSNKSIRLQNQINVSPHNNNVNDINSKSTAAATTKTPLAPNNMELISKIMNTQINNVEISSNLNDTPSSIINIVDTPTLQGVEGLECYKEDTSTKTFQNSDAVSDIVKNSVEYETMSEIPESGSKRNITKIEDHIESPESKKSMVLGNNSFPEEEHSSTLLPSPLLPTNYTQAIDKISEGTELNESENMEEGLPTDLSEATIHFDESNQDNASLNGTDDMQLYFVDSPEKDALKLSNISITYETDDKMIAPDVNPVDLEQLIPCPVVESPSQSLFVSDSQMENESELIQSFKANVDKNVKVITSNTPSACDITPTANATKTAPTRFTSKSADRLSQPRKSFESLRTPPTNIIRKSQTAPILGTTKQSVPVASISTTKKSLYQYRSPDERKTPASLKSSTTNRITPMNSKTKKNMPINDFSVKSKVSGSERNSTLVNQNSYYSGRQIKTPEAETALRRVLSTSAERLAKLRKGEILNDNHSPVFSTSVVPANATNEPTPPPICDTFKFRDSSILPLQVAFNHDDQVPLPTQIIHLSLTKDLERNGLLIDTTLIDEAPAREVIGYHSTELTHTCDYDNPFLSRDSVSDLSSIESAFCRQQLPIFSLEKLEREARKRKENAFKPLYSPVHSPAGHKATYKYSLGRDRVDIRGDYSESNDSNSKSIRFTAESANRLYKKGTKASKCKVISPSHRPHSSSSTGVVKSSVLAVKPIKSVNKQLNSQMKLGSQSTLLINNTSRKVEVKATKPSVDRLTKATTCQQTAVNDTKVATVTSLVERQTSQKMKKPMSTIEPSRTRTVSKSFQKQEVSVTKSHAAKSPVSPSIVSSVYPDATGNVNASISPTKKSTASTSIAKSFSRLFCSSDNDRGVPSTKKSPLHVERPSPSSKLNDAGSRKIPDTAKVKVMKNKTDNDSQIASSSQYGLSYTTAKRSALKPEVVVRSSSIQNRTTNVKGNPALQNPTKNLQNGSTAPSKSHTHATSIDLRKKSSAPAKFNPSSLDRLTKPTVARLASAKYACDLRNRIEASSELAKVDVGRVKNSTNDDSSSRSQRTPASFANNKNGDSVVDSASSAHSSPKNTSTMSRMLRGTSVSQIRRNKIASIAPISSSRRLATNTTAIDSNSISSHSSMNDGPARARERIRERMIKNQQLIKSESNLVKVSAAQSKDRVKISAEEGIARARERLLQRELDKRKQTK